MNVDVIGDAHCTTTRRMAMARRREQQLTMWLTATDLPTAVSHNGTSGGITLFGEIAGYRRWIRHDRVVRWITAPCTLAC